MTTAAKGRERERECKRQVIFSSFTLLRCLLFVWPKCSPLVAWHVDNGSNPKATLPTEILCHSVYLPQWTGYSTYCASDKIHTHTHTPRVFAKANDAFLNFCQFLLLPSSLLLRHPSRHRHPYVYATPWAYLFSSHLKPLRQLYFPLFLLLHFTHLTSPQFICSHIRQKWGRELANTRTAFHVISFSSRAVSKAKSIFTVHFQMPGETYTHRHTGRP